MLGHELFRLKMRAKLGWNNFIHEEKGAADIIAMVVILGIVIVLGFVFKDAIFKLFTSLWDGLVKNPAENGGKTKNITVDSIDLTNY